MQKDPELIALAREALQQAYAPYSGYRVGAALRCTDGSTYTGCNVENASYGLTMCAERTAVYAAVAAGRREFVRIAVVTETNPVPYPCGACLQVLAEWGQDIQIVVVSPDKSREGQLTQFLPRRFVFKSGQHVAAGAAAEDEPFEGRETL
jgi:cytidine deaminase